MSSLKRWPPRSAGRLIYSRAYLNVWHLNWRLRQMSYKCISPQLKSSCYNCSYYQVSMDMLNGLCFYKDKHVGQVAIGIGTCNNFEKKTSELSDYAFLKGNDRFA